MVCGLVWYQLVECGCGRWKLLDAVCEEHGSVDHILDCTALRECIIVVRIGLKIILKRYHRFGRCILDGRAICGRLTIWCCTLASAADWNRIVSSTTLFSVVMLLVILVSYRPSALARLDRFIDAVLVLLTTTATVGTMLVALLFLLRLLDGLSEIEF